jgi:erythronate-4-phosphate dehydrogenase
MKILVDENIPLAGELFGTIGDVTLVPGREVDEGFPGIGGFDALAIRSVTRVTPTLVDAARSARVIGTATIGTDHIDTAYVARANLTRERPLRVLSAPGSNAESVADYVWYAIGHVTSGWERALAGCSMGIIGCGNCGTRVERRARAFGMEVRLHDPPRAEREDRFRSEPLAEALKSDFVTLHVPLTRPGESGHPTRHMIGAAELSTMREGACFINCSRGAAVDSASLIGAMRSGRLGAAVLDVFEREPEPPVELIELPRIATPHIAGYAIEGKRRGAIVIYEGICRELGLEAIETEALLLRGFAPPAGVSVPFRSSGGGEPAADEAIRALLSAVHDIGAASRELKATLGEEGRGAAFDRMRRDYEKDHARHELAWYRVAPADSIDPALRALIERRLAAFGCRIGGARPNYVLAPV